MAKSATVLLILAIIIGPPVLIILSLSFATDHWTDYTVDRSKLNQQMKNHTSNSLVINKITHSRNRGLFRICYSGNDSKFLDNAKGVMDSNCFSVSYEDKAGASVEYSQRIHLMRSHLAFMVIGLALYVLAYIFGVVVCCARSSKWALIAAVFTFGTAFSTALAMAFFHGMEYLERNRIKDDPEFYSMWSQETKNATKRTYGFSYALGWVAMILSAIAGTFYAFAAWALKNERYEESMLFDNKSKMYEHGGYPLVATIQQPMYNPYNMHEPPSSYIYDNGYPGGGHMAVEKDMWQWQ